MRNQCPAPPHEPACPKPDDQERVHDTRYYLDEPNVTAYIASMGPELISIKIEADKLYHPILPYLPRSLKRIKAGDKTSSQRRIDYSNVRVYKDTSNSDWSGYGRRVIHNVWGSVFNLGPRHCRVRWITITASREFARIKCEVREEAEQLSQSVSR